MKGLAIRLRRNKRTDLVKVGKKNEEGNVLFLILIAVALFAALSYAVTQSTRSGSRDTDREQSLISSAQITQYPASVRTAILRMVIGGTATSDLLFDPPSDFVACAGDAETICPNDAVRLNAVFHPDGGGTPYQLAQPDILAAGNPQQQWIFSSGWEVDQIGISDGVATPSGNDIVAFLPNLAPSVCRRINEELGIATGGDTDGDEIPPTDSAAATLPTVLDHNMEWTATPAGQRGICSDAVCQGDVIDGPFAGQPYGCYDTSDGDGTAGNGPFIYYHVIGER